MAWSRHAPHTMSSIVQRAPPRGAKPGHRRAATAARSRHSSNLRPGEMVPRSGTFHLLPVSTRPSCNAFLADSHRQRRGAAGAGSRQRGLGPCSPRPFEGNRTTKARCRWQRAVGRGGPERRRGLAVAVPEGARGRRLVSSAGVDPAPPKKEVFAAFLSALAPQDTSSRAVRRPGVGAQFGALRSGRKRPYVPRGEGRRGTPELAPCRGFRAQVVARAGEARVVPLTGFEPVSQP